jgi:hypothetical protein
MYAAKSPAPSLLRAQGEAGKHLQKAVYDSRFSGATDAD